MNIDHIVKEELLRSFPVLFVSFLIIGLLIREGYIPLEMSRVFILALFVTAVHFFFMVWYRKKEQIDDNNFFNIIDHILSSKSHDEKITEINKDEKTKISSSIRKNMRLLILTILLYIIYLYASLVYNIDQVFWILIILFTGGALSKIIYGERKEDQKDPVRLLVFYVIACVFIFVRYLVLDYPILPILKGSIIFGILLVLLVLGIKWSQRKQNSDN
ncbi:MULTISPECIES: hypothetical protein [Methanosarcina]|jgi:hypothetical protein|uniref:Uncharacterized protein n=3 Tax=Methanosarcina mazei TaxID=2209 RepID=A0A0E3LUL0_METMZ|nr:MULTISPECIES: hypothetical protein [Methanosarcina]AKB65456.1 hypothetical protein MSMAS_2260 [Methanosarcina mazei S-6]AKB69388.1 hypothetical protein MSMAL_2845 [Methanosarcina mazei LYC]WIM42398.1 hypothetical protein PSF70_12885 [Methanosarcina mazei]WIM45854.1 hypothetical protein PQQ20_12795 [Methanosarcina mazei]